MNESQKLEEIQDRIAEAAKRAGRSADEVTLVAASKTVPVARLLGFLRAGLKDCGENYVQEGARKIEELRGEEMQPRWHFIGALQSNKARVAVRNFSLIHSLDRLSLAREINRAAQAENKIQDVLLQVNVSGESTKSGCVPEELGRLLEECASFSSIRAAGLMALPAFGVDAGTVRPSFVLLRELRDRFVPGGALSMGMSGDFEPAIEEGATHVRVGSALFGVRN